MNNVVREPIQVYLSPEERERLDRAARVLGVSRSEVLRRGIQAVGDPGGYAGVLRDLADDGWVTAPGTDPGDPPPSAPVAPLEELIAELTADHDAR
jgi:hypothetical protein